MKNTQSLLSILTKQLEVCSNYLSIQREMTKALVAGNIKQIDAIVRDEQSYMMKIEGLEKRREKFLEQEQLGGIKISEIISNHIDEDKDQFAEVSDKLLYVLFDLRKVNDLNQRLLKQRLSILESVVQIGDNEPVRRA